MSTNTGWHPSRKQWLVIWGAYVAAIAVNYDQFDLTGWTSNRPREYWTAFIAIGAALLVWRLRGVD